jgi:hypothetical protein
VHSLRFLHLGVDDEASSHASFAFEDGVVTELLLIQASTVLQDNQTA